MARVTGLSRFLRPVETKKVVQANRDKAMQKELERYLVHAIGRKPTSSLYPPLRTGDESKKAPHL